MTQKARTTIMTFVILAGLTACAPIVKIDEDARIRLRQQIKVYNPEELPGMKYNSLGAIDGISCMAKTSEPPASKEDAIDLLRYRSRALGGNGVTGVTCQQPQGLTLSPDCWNSVTCNAVAIQVEPIPHAPSIAAPQALVPGQTVEGSKQEVMKTTDTVRSQNVAELKFGVVRITAKQPEGAKKIGTGFIVRLEKDAAYIVTAAHVVVGDSQPQVEFFTNRNTPIPAVVLGAEGTDELRGLALLLVRDERNFRPGLTSLPLASTFQASGGEEVTVIGFPRGTGPWAVVRGSIVSRHGRDLDIAAPIDEGNSGGPIILNGKVIGLLTGLIHAYGLGIPAAIVQAFLEGFGITSSEVTNEPKTENTLSLNGGPRSRTIHIDEKLGKGDELVPLVFFKSNRVNLQQVPLDSVKLATFNPQTVLERSKAGRKAMDSLKEYASARQRLLSADEQDLKRLESQLKEGNRAMEPEFRQKLEKYQLRAKEFNTELNDKQKLLVDLYTARIEIAARRVAEKDNWDLVLDNFESGSKEAKDLVPSDVRQLLNSGLPDITSAMIEELDLLYK